MTYNNLLQAIELLRQDEGDNITWTIDRIEALELVERFIKAKQFDDYVDDLILVQEEQDKSLQEKLLDSYRDFVKSLDVQIVSSQRVLINVEDYELSDLQNKKIKQIKEIENE